MMDKFNPFQFAGRIGRLQYFGYAVIWAVVIGVVSAIIGVGADSNGEVGAGGMLSATVLLIVFAIGTVSYGVRRLHDFDKSGWWYLLTFVPFANIVMGLILLFAPGTPTANSYGTR